ncbi:MAG TPA: histidine kinase dimerization/phospho-acceptor domain-containing protein [Flavisolibacter sp.]|jgi:signal transduction histidine kinase|nr:histidine kinase dimerization/phospho-acceptor domain-containing protein [Flavisolibacter sp.]
MLLKHRFPLFFSFLFSLVLAVVMLTVYYLFSEFRKNEFKDRLAEKGESAVKILLEVKEIDRQLLRIFDSSTINRLYDEKTIIFNEKMEVIYSSLDDLTINWTPDDLQTIRQRNELFRNRGAQDLLGMHYPYDGKDYYVFVSAEDKYGNRNLHFLKFVLIGASLAGTVAIWLIAFLLSKKTLKPLDVLRKQMQDTTTKNLTRRVGEPRQNDEIKALSQSFNQMLDRIDKAYKSQKDFTGNASHELRTPIARIVMQLENLSANTTIVESDKQVLKSITEDAYQLSDIVTSLLVLSKTEETEGLAAMQPLRLDEVIFGAAAQLSRSYADFKLYFEIENVPEKNTTLEVLGDETLLKIAFLNLLKNGYYYSDNQIVRCTLGEEKGSLKLTFTNTGTTPKVQDTATLFNTFTRGSNSTHTQGSGIGLSIVRRILHYHNASIIYNIAGGNTNQLVIIFPSSQV